MSAQTRDLTRKEYSFIDAQGHYCEVWCSDDDGSDFDREDDDD